MGIILHHFQLKDFSEYHPQRVVNLKVADHSSTFLFLYVAAYMLFPNSFFI